MSNDKSSVYSEYDVRLQDVLKNETGKALTQGDIVAVEREGGEVKYPNGGIVQYLWPGQGVPSVGERYLLFVKCINGQVNLEIWTGYELTNNTVTAIDHNLGSDRLSSDYTGAKESSFIKSVKRLIVNPSAPTALTEIDASIDKLSVAQCAAPRASATLGLTNNTLWPNRTFTVVIDPRFSQVKRDAIWYGFTQWAAKTGPRQSGGNCSGVSFGSNYTVSSTNIPAGINPYGTYNIYVKYGTTNSADPASFGAGGFPTDVYATGGSGTVYYAYGDFEIRTLKETMVHEVGHLFGLQNCLVAGLCDYSSTVMTTGVQRAAGIWPGINGPWTCDLERSAQIDQYCLPEIVCGQSYPDQLLESDAYSAVRTVGFTDRYLISMNQGQTITISLSSSVFDTFLFLIGPNGLIASQDNNGNGGTNSKITYAPATSGSYRIEVTSNLPNKTGSYSLGVSCSAACFNPTGTPPGYNCDPPDEPCSIGSHWSTPWCSCICNSSPIIIDASGNGFSLTSAVNGVSFDINADGASEQLAWTAAASDDAFLVLDRNGDGQVNNGGELFGNYTLQPDAGEKNGFLALAELDKPANGGNGDGRVDGGDSEWASLRLWQDANHNGSSEAAELKSCASLGVTGFDLDYRESRRTDEYGNQFRYRAKVYDANGSHVGRWAWDVYLAQ